MKKPPASPKIPDVLEGYDPKDPATLEKVKKSVREAVRLLFLKMNRAQEPFVRVKNQFGRMPRTRMFESGNQVGKCATITTLIDTVNGPVPMGDLYATGKPFEVYAWDGERIVVAQGSAPFKKPGLHQCYRITMSNGRWVEVADHHLILCVDEIYRYASVLHQGFSAFLRESNSELAIPVHSVSASHLNRTPSSYLDRCSNGFRLHDGQLLSAGEVGQVSFPWQGDALRHIPALFCLDGWGRICTRILNELRGRPSSWYGRLRTGDRFSAWLGQVVLRLSLWFLGGLRLAPQPSIAEGPQLQSCTGFLQDQMESGSGASSWVPPLSFGNYVESITPIAPLQEVYDFEVPFFHNYYAAGLIHHNTTIGVAEDLAHAMGYRPWLKDDDPDFKVSVRVPNNGMVGCEVAGQTLSQRIEPEFINLIPKYCAPQISRYSDGSIKSLTLTFDTNGNACGSTIHFRSYVQPAESYEGVVLDWIHFDEPPPQAILNAATRGLMSTNGPSWYTMTPLKEAYIYDLLSLNAYNNGGTDPEIAVFRGSTWDNCQDWCKQCDVTIEENKPENLKPGEVRPVNKCPKCGRVMGFLPRAGIENYLKKITDPDEREARENGKWKHLSGLVYKELSRDLHVVPDFRIPNDWMRIEIVDPHDARPTRWLFGAVSPEEITINNKAANRIYFYGYLLASGNIDAIVRQVRVRRAENNYREPEMVILDAKFGSKSIRTQEEETTWEEELAKAGIKRIVLSHSAPGNIELGHKRVKEYLGMHYSVVKDKSYPGMMFAEMGCKGDRGPIQDMFNYMWKEGTDKPEEAYKDFCDCVRYTALEQPVYRPPRPEIDADLAALILNKEKNSEAGNPLYIGLSMRR